MDTTSAKRADGVVSILTPDNAPKLPGAEKRLSLLQDDLIHYNKQPIAVVVAKTLHQAQYAASLIRTQYVETPAKLDFVAGFPTSYPGSHNNEPGDVSWGDIDSGVSQAEVKIDQIYTTPINHHNPMEPHATIAHWDGDRLLLHDATQHISGVQESLAKLLA